MLEKHGGYRPNGAQADVAGHERSDHETSSIPIPSIRIGNWQAAPDAGAGPYRRARDTTGGAVMLFERMDSMGDMMRVAATAQISPPRSVGSYIPRGTPAMSPTR